MADRHTKSLLPLPRQWKRSIQATIVQVMALAHYALTTTRSRAATSVNDRVRHGAKSDALTAEIALLREEIRIKDARLARIAPAQRPHYQPVDRLAILELRAARGWSLAQTARVFQVTAATIASWCKRLDEDGPAALLKTPVPVNRFPDLVRYTVQRLQTLCPRLGKVKIAQILARAGLHLGATTVGRMRQAKPKLPSRGHSENASSERRIKASCRNHVWHVDLTTVPISAGFWVSWLPFALPQSWPFCWWLGLVVDHYSRRVLGFTLFSQQPSSEQVRCFLARVIGAIGESPRHLITDRGTQFSCDGFKDWCRRHTIRQRFGAVGQYGSIAVIERAIRTLKESIRAMAAVPLVRRTFQRELHLLISWYNGDRPHTTLRGATPDEIYFGTRPACRQPRFEPRPTWPRGSPCAQPVVLVKGRPGVPLRASVAFIAHRRHLPRITLTRAA